LTKISLFNPFSFALFTKNYTKEGEKKISSFKFFPFLAPIGQCPRKGVEVTFGKNRRE
jgi:hypothetical protein